MFKEDPPATVVREPSYHGSEVAQVQGVEQGNGIINHCNSVDCIDTATLADNDCADIFCDPAEVLGQILSFGQNKREELSYDTTDDKKSNILNNKQIHQHQVGSESASDDRSKKSDEESGPGTPVKRGRFLVWPVSPR